MGTQLASWLCFFLCYFSYLTIHFSPVSGACLEDQKSLLIQMKNNLTFDPEFSDSLGSWNPHLEADCCLWNGVYCDEEGHVTELSLLSDSISGELSNSNSLFSLQNLQNLDLKNNNLTGPTPSFGMLKELTSIDLSFNHFSGPIPPFGMLKKLTSIDLSQNHFSGPIPSFGMVKNLTFINLSNNHLSGPLPSFGMAKKLTFIDLSYNNFRGPISLGYFEGLQDLGYIYLQSNSLNGSIPSSLFSLPSLEEIQLSCNQLDGKLNKFSFLSNSTLRTLNLSSNNLRGPIPMSVFHLNNLESLSLSSNNFSGTINLHMIPNHENLTQLDLSYNNLLIEGDQFPFPNMWSLHLAACKLSEFPVFLRNQSSVMDLDLSNNQIQGKLPNWIWTLYSLQSLHVSHNLLTGFEGPLQNFYSDLSAVDLHSNKLHGQLPVFLLHVPDYLDVSGNGFHSVIPYDIGNDTLQRHFISLSNNSFHGSIPPSLCTSSHTVLDLSHNNFVGRIPRCLIEIENLTVLNLGDNKLHGNIPDTFPESCGLKSLHLYGNQLSGPLPKSLVNCKELEVLDVGRNHINDVFPYFLMNISTLRVIVLRENKFQGPVECPTMTNLSLVLQIVDLAFNNFGGKLPRKCFTTWNGMMLDEDKDAPNLDHIQFSILEFSPLYQDSVTVTFKGLEMQLVKILTIFTSIDFSSNHFEGPIPEELMNLKALYVLNLSHNSLSGQIPSSIGNLIHLESLDLSNNLLDGEIPMQLANLNFLSFLNLSFNNLVGKIPTGTQIQTFEESSFEGNKLCGPPLTKNCGNPVQIKSNSTTESSFNWNFINSELGFIFGIGMIFLPLLFWKRWRLWYWKFIDDILHHIFSQLDFVHECHGGKNYKILRWKWR